MGWSWCSAAYPQLTVPHRCAQLLHASAQARGCRQDRGDGGPRGGDGASSCGQGGAGGWRPRCQPSQRVCKWTDRHRGQAHWPRAAAACSIERGAGGGRRARSDAWPCVRGGHAEESFRHGPAILGAAMRLGGPAIGTQQSRGSRPQAASGATRLLLGASQLRSPAAWSCSCVRRRLTSQHGRAMASRGPMREARLFS